MNWLDIVFLIIIAWSAWRGFAAGLIAGLARLAGLFLGLVMAFNYAVPLAQYADKQWHLQDKITGWWPVPPGREGFPGLGKLPQFFAPGLIEIVAFLLIFLVVAQLTYRVGSMVAAAGRAVFLGPVDRLGGLALGILRGVVIVLVFLALLAPLHTSAFSFPGGHQGSWGWFSRALEQSVLASFFWPFLVKLPMIFPGLPLKSGVDV
ncbi:MAG: CvpA family protein [Bacillota bacterium]